mgnify:CR=1 FL=1
MPSGLVALLDDISVIARMAATSLDDVGAAAAKAGTKAAGVVVDDAAVTPGYVTDFTPDRELPIIWQITKGSLRNKLLILLPAALLLSEFVPWAVTPLLMLGGLFLCFEGAEKVLEKLTGAHHGEVLGDAIEDIAAFERERVTGAIRTDFIRSGEIKAFALAEIGGEPLATRAAILAVVAVAITAAVYGAVALIVKMDDIGLHLAASGRAAATRGLGRGLVRGMPRLMAALSLVGTAAMLWVGGAIVVHGLEGMGAPWLGHTIHDGAALAGRWLPGGTAAVEWLATAAMDGLFGLGLGFLMIPLATRVIAPAWGAVTGR